MTPDSEPQAEHLAFDKAEEAASIENIRIEIASVDAALKALDGAEGDVDAAERTSLEEKKVRLVELLKAAEADIKAREIDESRRD